MTAQSVKTPTKDRTDKRVRLLAAALELFETRGFDGVAVPEIAKAAGVATGTIYRYFETKEALVNALYRHWRTAYNQIVLAPAPAHFSPRQAFSFRWQRLMLFARSNPRVLRFLALHYHVPYLDAESLALDAAEHAATERFIARLRKAGAIVPLSPSLVTALIWGAAAGLLKFSRDARSAFDAAAAADMEDALWRALGL